MAFNDENLKRLTEVQENLLPDERNENIIALLARLEVAEVEDAGRTNESLLETKRYADKAAYDVLNLSKDRDLWESRAEKLARALKTISFAQRDGHPLTLMKVARKALSDFSEAKLSEGKTFEAGKEKL